MSDGTPKHEECNMDYSDDEDDPRNDADEYIGGSVNTTPPRRTKGPQARYRKRIDGAKYYWEPTVVTNFDETPKISGGR